jgi:hypothetical protein
MEPRGQFAVCDGAFAQVPCREHFAFSVSPHEVRDAWAVQDEGDVQRAADDVTTELDSEGALRAVAFVLMECVRKFVGTLSHNDELQPSSKVHQTRQTRSAAKTRGAKKRGAKTAPRATPAGADVREFRMARQRVAPQMPSAPEVADADGREARVYHKQRQRLFEHFVAETGMHDAARGEPVECGEPTETTVAWWKAHAPQGVVCLVEYVFREGAAVSDAAAQTFCEFMLSGENAVESITVHWLLRDRLPTDILDAMLARLLGSPRADCGADNVVAGVGQKRTRTRDAPDVEDDERRDSLVERAQGVADSVRARSVLGRRKISARRFAALVRMAGQRMRGHAPLRAPDEDDELDAEDAPPVQVREWLSCHSALLQRSQRCSAGQTFRHWVQRRDGTFCHYTPASVTVADGRLDAAASRSVLSKSSSRARAWRWCRPDGALVLRALPGGLPPVSRRLEEWLSVALGRSGFRSLFETLYPTLFCRGEDAVPPTYGVVEPSDAYDPGDLSRLAQSVYWMDQTFFAQRGVDAASVPGEFVTHAPPLGLARVEDCWCLPTTVFAVTLAARGGDEMPGVDALCSSDESALRASLRTVWESVRRAVDQSYRRTARQVFMEIMGGDKAGGDAVGASGCTSDTMQCLRDSGVLQGAAGRVVRRGDTTQRELLGSAAGAGVENATLEAMLEAAHEFAAQVRARYEFLDQVVAKPGAGGVAKAGRPQCVTLAGCGEQRAIRRLTRGRGAQQSEAWPCMLEYLRDRATRVEGRLRNLCARADTPDHFMHVLRTAHQRDVLRAYAQFGRGARAGISDAQRAIDRFAAETGLFGRRQRVGLQKLDTGLDTLSNLRGILAMWYDCVYNCAVPTVLDMLYVCALDASRLARDLHLNVVLVGASDTHKAFLLSCLAELRIGGARSQGGGTCVRMNAACPDACTRPDGDRPAGDGHANGCVWIHNEARTRRMLGRSDCSDGLRRSELQYADNDTNHDGLAPMDARALQTQLDECTTPEGGAAVGVHVFVKRGRVGAMAPALLERTVILHMAKRRRDAINTQSRIVTEYADDAELVAVRQKRQQCTRLHHFLQAAKSEIERLITVGAMRDVGMDLFAMVFLFLEERMADCGASFLPPRKVRLVRALVRTLCIQDVVAREFCFEGGLFRHADATPEAFVKLEPLLVVRMNHVTVGLGMILPHFFPQQVDMVRSLLRGMFVKQLIRTGHGGSFIEAPLPPIKRSDLIRRGIFMLGVDYTQNMRPGDGTLLLRARAAAHKADLAADTEDAAAAPGSDSDDDHVDDDSSSGGAAAATSPRATSQPRALAAPIGSKREAGTAWRRQCNAHAPIAVPCTNVDGASEADRAAVELCLAPGTAEAAMADVEMMPPDSVYRKLCGETPNVVPPTGFAERQRTGGAFYSMVNAENPLRAPRRRAASAQLDPIAAHADEQVQGRREPLQLVGPNDREALGAFLRTNAPEQQAQNALERMEHALAFDDQAESERARDDFGSVLKKVLNAREDTSIFADCSLSRISTRAVAPNLRRGGATIGDGNEPPAAVLTELLLNTHSYSNVILDHSGIEYALDIMKAQWTRARRYTVTDSLIASHGELTGLPVPHTKRVPKDVRKSGTVDMDLGERATAEDTDELTERALGILETRARELTDVAWLKQAARRYGASLAILNARAALIRKNAVFACYRRELKERHYAMLRTVGSAKRWQMLLQRATLGTGTGLCGEIEFMRRSMRGTDEACLASLQRSLRSLIRRNLPAETGERAYIEGAVRILRDAVAYRKKFGGGGDDERPGYNGDPAQALLPRAIGDETQKPNDPVLFFDARVVTERACDLVVPTHWLFSNMHRAMDAMVRDMLHDFMSRAHQTPMRTTWVPDTQLDAVYTTFTFGEAERESGSSVGATPCDEREEGVSPLRRPLCVSRLNMLSDLETALSDAMLAASDAAATGASGGAGFGDSIISERMTNANAAWLQEAPAAGCGGDFSEMSGPSRQWETLASGVCGANATPKLLMSLNVSAEAWAVGRHARRCGLVVQHVSSALMALCVYALDMLTMRPDTHAPHRTRRFDSKAFQALDVRTNRALAHLDYTVAAVAGDPGVVESEHARGEQDDALVLPGARIPHWRVVNGSVAGPDDTMPEEQSARDDQVALSAREHYMSLLHALTPVLEHRTNRRGGGRVALDSASWFRYPDTLRERYSNARLAEVLSSFGAKALPSAMLERASDSARISLRDAANSAAVLKVLTTATAAARQACLQQSQARLARTHKALNGQLATMLKRTRGAAPQSVRRAAVLECTNRQGRSLNLRRAIADRATATVQLAARDLASADAEARHAERAPRNAHNVVEIDDEASEPAQPKAVPRASVDDSVAQSIRQLSEAQKELCATLREVKDRMDAPRASPEPRRVPDVVAPETPPAPVSASAESAPAASVQPRASSKMIYDDDDDDEDDDAWDADADYMDTEGHSGLVFSNNSSPTTTPPSTATDTQQRAAPSVRHDSRVLHSERCDTKWIEFL